MSIEHIPANNFIFAKVRILFLPYNLYRISGLLPQNANERAFKLVSELLYSVVGGVIMNKIFLTILTICNFNFVQAQVLLNIPEGPVAFAIGTVDFDGIEISRSQTQPDSVHANLSVPERNNPSSLTCIAMKSSSGNLNYLTTRVQIAGKNILGNFSFDSFHKCKLVASKMVQGAGSKVRFKMILDSSDPNTGKIISVEWIN